MWYVIQTTTGKEDELVDAIENILAGSRQSNIYKRCFTIYRECIWRIEGEFRLRIEPLFPSYVFAETDNPDAFFIALKQVPRLSKLLGVEDIFWSVGEEEERFLRDLVEMADTVAGENDETGAGSKNDIKEWKWKRRDGSPNGGKTERYLVRRSLVQVDSEGQIVSAEGVLKNYMNRIVKQRLRKRSVIIEIPFMGEMRRVQLGIRLEEDEMLLVGI